METLNCRRRFCISRSTVAMTIVYKTLGVSQFFVIEQQSSKMKSMIHFSVRNPVSFLLSIALFLFAPIAFASSLSLEEVYSNQYQEKGTFIFSRFFFDNASDKFVLVVDQTSPELKNEEWYPVKNGWLIQSPYGEKNIYFTNVTDQEAAKEFVRNTRTSRFSVMNFLLPQAWAGSQCTPYTQAASKMPQSTGMNVGNVLNVLSKCQESALSGFKNALAGTAENVKKLVTNPLQFFDDLGKQMSNLVSFVKNIKSHLIGLQQALSEMPASQAQQFLCSWLGSLGSDVLLSILTGGATAAILIKTAASLQRFTRIITSSFRLKRLGVSSKFTDASFLKRMNACAL